MRRAFALTSLKARALSRISSSFACSIERNEMDNMVSPVSEKSNIAPNLPTYESWDISSTPILSPSYSATERAFLLNIA